MDASIPRLLGELDKALWKAVKKEDIKEVKKLLLQGEDPSWTASSCYFSVKSCVVEANRNKASADLLHSFGCADQDL